MPKLLSFFLASLLAGTFTVSAHATVPSADEACNESTRNEIECHIRIADRAETQLAKDFRFLTALAHSRNPKSGVFLKMGQLAFKNYLQQNCLSESHDAFGGSLEEVLEQKCRRDSVLARRRLFEQIGEPHPLGRQAEKEFGRPVCSSFTDKSKPLEIGTLVNVADAEHLRSTLDRVGARAAAGGVYKPEVAKLLRAVHEEAGRQSRYDATFTCLGIYEGFCNEAPVRSEWLSRCQTQIHGAFYKRATTRLRMLKSQ